MPFRVPMALNSLKATAVPPYDGRGGLAPGGVLDHGTQEEDDPGTWETLAFLGTFRSYGESGEPFSGARVFCGPRGGQGKKSVRIEVGLRQGEPESRPMERGSRRAAK